MEVVSTITEPEKKIPVVKQYDILVVGGGIAGAAAALAAARKKVRVAILEKQNTLGGLATLGLVAIYLPLCDGMGHQVIGGISEEFLKRSIQYGPGSIPGAWEAGGTAEDRKSQRYELEFNPASLAISLEELLLDSGVELIYDTRICSAVVQSDRITHLIGENKSGRVAFGCKAVVDTSGDADICFLAGESTQSLDTNRKSGWFYDYDGSGVNLHMLTDPLYGEVPKGSRTYGGDDYLDVSQNSIDARRMIVEKLWELRQHHKNQGIYPLVIPSIPQLRMTRRLVGRYALKPEDERVFFKDAVCMTGDWRNKGPVYYIPFSSLYGRINNLIAAGRCISAEGDTWDIVRAIPTCAATGQAAGTAAACLVQQECSGFSELDVKRLQTILRDDGVLLFEVPSAE